MKEKSQPQNPDLSIRLIEDEENILLREDLRYSTLLRAKMLAQMFTEKDRSNKGEIAICANGVIVDSVDEFDMDALLLHKKGITKPYNVSEELTKEVEDFIGELTDYIEENENVDVRIVVTHSIGIADTLAVYIYGDEEPDEEELDQDEEELDQDEEELDQDEEELDQDEEELTW